MGHCTFFFVKKTVYLLFGFNSVIRLNRVKWPLVEIWRGSNVAPTKLQLNYCSLSLLTCPPLFYLYIYTHTFLKDPSLLSLYLHTYISEGERIPEHEEDEAGVYDWTCYLCTIPDMPKIQAFHLLNGSPVSKSLQIGMFYKKWVTSLFGFIKESFVLCFFWRIAWCSGFSTVFSLN